MIELNKKYNKSSLKKEVVHAIMIADDEWFNPEYDSYAKNNSTGEHDECYFDYLARCVVNAIVKRSSL